MSVLKEITATALRRDLFKVLKSVSKSPTKIRYKKRYSVILPYEEYQNLTRLKHKKKGTLMKLKPLTGGKILKSLGKQADQELLDYMGI